MIASQAEPQLRISQPDSVAGHTLQAIAWSGGLDGCLRLLDQTRLPLEQVYRECREETAVHAAIRELCVRGAPAIGVAAAYGFVLGLRASRAATLSELTSAGQRVRDYLAGARPTAVNLFWALNRMAEALTGAAAGQPDGPGAVQSVLQQMLDEAHRMWRADAEVCRRIGEHGAALIRAGAAILTHCNAGALATVAWGTALAAVYVAHEQGKPLHVYADETRPLLQGARLTAFELASAGIPVTVLCDGAAAALMATRRVDLVIVGADRIAANGDTANKIGTYGVALAAKAHGVPFYVAAPTSTFDLSLPDGRSIPIEERSADEVQHVDGKRITPSGVGSWNPAFDVTPAGLIEAMITENGLVKPVTEEVIRRVVGKN